MDKFVSFAHEMADCSGEIIRNAYRSMKRIDIKSDDSPVTETDRAVEKALRTMIEAEYPDHGIIGEEYGTVRNDAEYVWLIDPIDGTKAFIVGIPVFGTLIALARRGEPILGVIDHPISRERWIGADGRQTTLNGRPVYTRNCRDVKKALLATSNPEHFKGPDHTCFDRVRSAVNWTIYGGSCYAYGLLSSGTLDIGMEAEHDPVDYSAMVPVIRNAGGKITDWQGNPLTIRSGRRFVATGDPELHDEVIRLIAGR
jgi:histidinol phosphatase-like enzyme (inositol monophosphatase family)